MNEIIFIIEFEDMRFASAFALIFGAASADVQRSEIVNDGGTDIGGLGTMTYHYWHSWDDATPNEITFNETFEVELADGADFAAGDKAQWFWCETDPYDEAAGTDVLCNIYGFAESSNAVSWTSLTLGAGLAAKVTGDVEPAIAILGGAKKILNKSKLTFDADGVATL